jgi:hypothetical protein
MAHEEILAKRAGALTFKAHRYPTNYLHPVRVDAAFVSYLGSVQSYSLRSERALGGEVGVNWVLTAKGKVDKSSGEEVAFNLADPLVRALVLRAHLEDQHLLHRDIRAAPPDSFVLACGSGSFAYPATEGGPGYSADNLLPAEVAAEVRQEQDRRGVKRHDDHHPEYWVLYCDTGVGLGIALLGVSEIVDPGGLISLAGEHRNWCIFGEKMKVGPSGWTLINPYHAWREVGTT